MDAGGAAVADEGEHLLEDPAQRRDVVLLLEGGEAVQQDDDPRQPAAGLLAVLADVRSARLRQECGALGERAAEEAHQARRALHVAALEHRSDGRKHLERLEPTPGEVEPVHVDVAAGRCRGRSGDRPEQGALACTAGSEHAHAAVSVEVEDCRPLRLVVRVVQQTDGHDAIAGRRHREQVVRREQVGEPGAAGGGDRGGGRGVLDRGDQPLYVGRVLDVDLGPGVLGHVPLDEAAEPQLGDVHGRPTPGSRRPAADVAGLEGDQLARAELCDAPPRDARVEGRRPPARR